MLGWLLNRVIKSYCKGTTGNKLNILTYHRVDEFSDPHNPLVLSVTKFHQQLKWLKSHFNVLPLQEAIELLEKNQLPAGAVCLTVDDGYSDGYYHIYRLLKEEGMVASFFIATEGLETGALWDESIRHVFNKAPNDMSSIEFGDKTYDISTFRKRISARDEIIEIIKYLPVEQREETIKQLYAQTHVKPCPHSFLSVAQIKEMHENGMLIGGHTHSHPILAVENDDYSRTQIERCNQILEEILGTKVEFFAFPNGKFGKDFTQAHCDMLKDLGLKIGLSTNWGSLEDLAKDKYHIKRFTPWDDTKWRFCFRLAFNYKG